MTTTGTEPGPAQTILPDPKLSNAEIADRLASLAQLLSTQKENPYKIKAYTRAAAKIRTLSESVDELVRDDADLTAYAGIGEAIASAIREIVLTGTLGKLEKLRSAASPELASISAFPRLDPKRVFRIYKKLGIPPLKYFAKDSKMARSKNTWDCAWLNMCGRALLRPTPCCCTGRTTSASPLKSSCSTSAASAAPKRWAIIGAGWTSLRNWPSSSRRTILRLWSPGWSAMADAPHS